MKDSEKLCSGFPRAPLGVPVSCRQVSNSPFAREEQDRAGKMPALPGARGVTRPSTTCLVWKLCTLLLTFIASIVALHGQAPPFNDECSGAVSIPDTGPFPYLTPIVDITSASTNGDPEFPTCGSTLSRSVWYRFSPDTSGMYGFSVCDDTATTVHDTVMALYQSLNGCSGPFSEIGCNDDACGLRSGMTAALTKGRVYYLVAWQFGTDAPLPGETAMQVRVSKLLVPANDNCSGSIVIPGRGPFPHFTVISDLTLAGTNGDPSPPSCQANLSSSVWYQFTPATAAVYRISTCIGETATTLKDSVMAVYTSPGCGGPFVEVACNDDGCGSQAALTVSLAAGTAYRILVWVYDTTGPPIGGSDVQLRVARVLMPRVAGTGSSNVTASAATFYAAINPGEGNTLAGFEWGTTTNYGNRSTFELVGSGAGNISVSVIATGLLPNKTYHFRGLATNEAGIAVGPDATLETAPAPILGAPVILPEGVFEFRFTGFAGTIYTVMGSTNLVNWMFLDSAEEIESGQFRFQDATAPSFSSRFYRVTAP